jgi:ATP-binding cassette subfamily B protein
LQELWQLVALEFALALLTDGLNRMINLTDSLLGDLFSNYTSIRIMKHAATLDLDQFVFYDVRARQTTNSWTYNFAFSGNESSTFSLWLFLLTALIAFNLVDSTLVLAIIPSFLGESYFNSKNYALSRSQTPERRELITCVIWELVTKLQRK